MNTAKVDQASGQAIAGSQSQQQQMGNNNGNGGSSAASSIWGFPSSQANGTAPSSSGDQPSNKLSNLWSLQWSEGSGNEMPNASGPNSVAGNPSGASVWGMGALDDLMTSSNGNGNGNEKNSNQGNGNDSRTAQQPGAATELSGSGSKSNWSSAGGNPGDSPNSATGAGGNSGVISPGGSSNGSVSGISASDSKLITQWIGDSSNMSGPDSSSVITGTGAWGSTNLMNSGSNPGNSNSNWGPAGNISSDSGSWQQQPNQPQQHSGDQSWGNNSGNRVPTSVRSYSQAATGSATQGQQQGQQQPQQQQSQQHFHQQVPSSGNQSGPQQQQQQQQPQQPSQQPSSQQNLVPMGSASSPCSPPLIEQYIDTRRDEEMRQLVENCDGWGQRTVNQETTWDVEDIPEAKPRTDENPNVWPTFVNKGTNGWEESCRRRKVTPGSHHAPALPSGWGESHQAPPPPPKQVPAAPPADSWNKWSAAAPPQQPAQPVMPWTGSSGHGGLENRHSGGNWAEDNSHRSVPNSRDESPMGPPNNGSMWPSEQGSNNWNRSNISGIGTWQQPQPQSVLSPSSGPNESRVGTWTDGIGQWSGAAPKPKGSSSGDSVAGDFEVEQWNNPGHAKDNDYGEFEDMLPKRWSSASSSQAMPPTGGPGGMGQRRIKSSDMTMNMPPGSSGEGAFGQMNPQRSALTETLMQLGVSKDDATKALINSDNDYAQAIRWLVQQGKLSPSCLNPSTTPGMASGQSRPNTGGSQADMFGNQSRGSSSGNFGGQNSGPMPPGGAYPPGSPNHMMPGQQQPAALSLQDRIRLAQQRSQVKLNALPPSSNQVIVEQLRKAVHNGYLNQHVLNMQLSQDVLKLIHDLINHQIVLEQVQRDDQQLQQQQQQIQMMKLPPMSPQAQAVDQQRQALQHEMCRIRLIMEQRKVQIGQRTGTVVTPTPGVPATGGASPVGGSQPQQASGGSNPAASGMMPSGGRNMGSQQQSGMGRSMAPAGEFSQLSLGGGGGNEQSKLMQWRMQTTPERSGGDSRATPASDNWMTMPNSSSGHFSPNNSDNRSQAPGITTGPAVVEFVPGKPWTGLSMQSAEDDPHMTPASAAKPPLAIGSDTYLDTLAKNGNAPGHQLVGGQPRMSSTPAQSGSSSSPRPTGVQQWSSGGNAGPQMQYGRPQSSTAANSNWGGSPWGTGASVPMSGSDMDPSRFLQWGGMANGSSAGNNNAGSGYDPSRLAGNFM